VALKNLDLPTSLPATAESAIGAVARRLAGESTHVFRCLRVAAGGVQKGPLWNLDADVFVGLPIRTMLLDPGSQLSADQEAGFSATGLVKIRAVPDKDGDPRLGILRSFTIFSDGTGASVALLEEPGATEIQIRWSWGDPQRFVQRLATGAEELWDCGTESVAPLPPSRPTVAPVSGTSSVVKEDSPGEAWTKPTSFFIPSEIHPRDYQKDAMRAWLEAGGRGILAMATGAGKTLTALCLACKVAEQNRPLVIVVVCPFLNLATQWIREMAQFGLTPIGCFHSREKWERLLQEAYQRVAAGLTNCISVVVSNATFLSPVFQSALRPTLAQHLLIADEVHNLGAANLRNALPKGISLRLGLSATPERHGDAAGTEAIFDYFGEVVFEFGIDRAIREGVLVPYRYHPVVVDLTDDEAGSYRELTARIARAWSRSEDADESEQLKMLLIKRARSLASAANKLPALSEVLRTHGEAVEMAIVYCGDGTVECPATAEVDRQILAVTRLLGEGHQLKVRKFTCDESPEDREGILTALRNGGLHAVVAIRCLDEGIDVPDVRLGFLLASSTNPRQFIQRRGRLLRRAPGKTKAIIYDFIVRPPDFGGESDANAFNVERRLFGRELERVLEFCRSAENGPIALQQLQGLRLNYNLLAH
jgi:DNA phosphorothioation system restriction enzyme